MLMKIAFSIIWVVATAFLAWTFLAAFAMLIFGTAWEWLVYVEYAAGFIAIAAWAYLSWRVLGAVFTTARTTR
jgi:hypothetical protein